MRKMTNRRYTYSKINGNFIVKRQYWRMRRRSWCRRWVCGMVLLVLGSGSTRQVECW